MSRLSTYMEKERLMKQLQEELQALKNNQEMQRELEFKEQLEMLMGEYDKSAREVVELLSPNTPVQSNDEPQRQRRKRKLKVYRNPHTNETIETRGGNNKALKAWKDEFGADEVEGWLEDQREAG